jgi:zinc protease
MKHFLETLYEHHPYGSLSMGSLESVAKIDSAKLKLFHKNWIQPERLVLSVVGGVKRDSLEHWLEKLDDSLKKYAGVKPSVRLQLADTVEEEPALKAPRWIEKSLKREQAHIMVGGFGTRIGSPDRYALRLMDTILGGMSGRLFIELREKKSLAYSVSPVSFEGIEKGYIGTYIACANSKRNEAIAGIKDVLKKFAQKGPTADEMKRAQEYLLGRRFMDLQADSSLSTYYGLNALYGVDLITDDEYIKRIRKVKPKDVQEVCRRYLVDPHQVTSVVG